MSATPPAAAIRRLVTGTHTSPHDLLGAHPATVGTVGGAVVRALHPDAVAVDVLRPGHPITPLVPQGDGLFTVFLPDAQVPLRYRLRFHFPDGRTWERDDPYRFLPTLGSLDLHLFGEGTHRRLWRHLGAHVRRIDDVDGVAFAVWAPNARRVSVVGDFCGWDGRLFPMRQLGGSGVFELFVPELPPGSLYKFEILTPQHTLRLKTDPFAAAMERTPGSASRVVAPSTYAWSDARWMQRRAAHDPTRAPMATYEVHLGSLARVPEENNRSLGFREIAPRLAAHVRGLGFTHVELLPIMEHPFEGSWGYQVTGYYAPTARWGTPDDFRFFVDTCHQEGLGVILDWVPAHFPRDDYALRRFDGTALYEHDDPRRGEHPDWGTLIFNYGRREVANFLTANALYWLDEFHVDGLRIDAVASMLYLDYSRREGAWLPNPQGGRENLDAVAFLRDLNDTIAVEQPGCFTIAEESTAWPGVTHPTSEGGLGFSLKWNMGWMHDTLGYFAREAVHRRFHHDELTFAMLYEHRERFVNPLSHDEVVHGKRSLLEKMPGDEWQKLANLRLLLAYQYTRPGKQLLFMGTELAPYAEWNHDGSLDWHLGEQPARRGFAHFLATLGAFYQSRSCFWRSDPDADGFAWIDCADRDASVVSFQRRDGDAHVVVVLNLTPVPRPGYRVGVPTHAAYALRLDSDAAEFGGSGHPMPATFSPEPVPWHGHPQSIVVRLPPLGALLLEPA
jgi:1,4-alpha-glucan branching enzyme